MEHNEQEIYAVREHKQSRYDKRLILKVVREIEAGLPRKEANRIYGLGKSTLHGSIPCLRPKAPLQRGIESNSAKGSLGEEETCTEDIRVHYSRFTYTFTTSYLQIFFRNIFFRGETEEAGAPQSRGGTDRLA